LERLGWVFCRVGANLFFREPEKAMLPILKKLDTMGISSSEEFPICKSLQDNEFIERVKIRAHEIRYKYFGN